MRKKKIGIALVILLVMAAVLSIRAHAADSPQAVIDADGSGTTISVTDITPREDTGEFDANTSHGYDANYDTSASAGDGYGNSSLGRFHQF